MEDVLKNDELTTEETEKTDEISTKKTKSEKSEKPDKLAALKAKREKAVQAVEKAESKAKAVEAEIAAEEKKLHDKEIKRLDGLCSKLKIGLTDVIKLVESISENNLTLNEVTELIGTK